MYRRLIVFGLAVCASALIALIVPLALSARDLVQSTQLSAAAGEARAVAAQWQQGTDKHGRTLIPIPDLSGPGQVTLISPRGQVAGPNPPQASRAVEAAQRGGAASDVVDGVGYVSAPAYFDDAEFGVVLVALTPAELRAGLAPRLAAIAGVSLILLVIAAVTAWWLARRTVAPLMDLEHTANAVAAGDLDARAEPSSITEIDNVAVSLNRLTARVQELLHEEREYTSELAHQLRTPLTALSVDVDAVTDARVRVQLEDDVLAVHRMVDEIITTARRSGREGLLARCDACAVVRGRAQFWQVLAEDQHRDFSQEIPERSLPVRLTADDLAAALDILFQNVFLHTAEGTAFGVRVAPGNGVVEVSVWDRGHGFEPTRDKDMVGSTQLGLSIARRLAEASGGSMELLNDDGATVTLRLGPPQR